MQFKHRFIVCLLTVHFLYGCTNKEIDHQQESGPPTPAGEIAGHFVGTGNYMPENVVLTSSGACQLPADWETYYKTGTATVTINQITDSTIAMTLGGIFPARYYNNLIVRFDNANVEFDNGHYDTATKQLFIEQKAGCLHSGACNFCNQSVSYFPPDAITNSPAIYVSVGTLEFLGSKQ